MNAVRLAAYASPLIAYEKPTGVGQHILGMFAALQERDDIDFRLVTPRGQEVEAAKLLGSNLRSRVLPVPLRDRPLRVTSSWLPLVSLDRWLGDSDWVYTPVEQPVTTSRQLAVTVHDLFRFEPTIHGLSDKRRPGLSWRRRMSRICARADIIATVSHFTRARLLELCDVRRPERVVVVGNGGAEEFCPKRLPDDEDVLRRLNVESDKFVLFPASLTKRKAGDLLLEVATHAWSRRESLQFLVVGRRHEPDLLDQWRASCERMPGFPVRLTGYVDKTELAALYRHARAAFFPSRYEGFGIPVIEALACECRLVISPQPALVEIAGGCAEIVEPDPGKILDVLFDRRPTLKAHEISKTHTWSQCVQRLLVAMG